MHIFKGYQHLLLIEVDAAFVGGLLGLVLRDVLTHIEERGKECPAQEMGGRLEDVLDVVAFHAKLGCECDLREHAGEGDTHLGIGGHEGFRRRLSRRGGVVEQGRGQSCRQASWGSRLM